LNPPPPPLLPPHPPPLPPGRHHGQQSGARPNVQDVHAPSLGIRLETLHQPSAASTQGFSRESGAARPGHVSHQWGIQGWRHLRETLAATPDGCIIRRVALHICHHVVVPGRYERVVRQQQQPAGAFIAGRAASAAAAGCGALHLKQQRAVAPTALQQHLHPPEQQLSPALVLSTADAHEALAAHISPEQRAAHCTSLMMQQQQRPLLAPTCTPVPTALLPGRYCRPSCSDAQPGTPAGSWLTPVLHTCCP